MSLTTSTWKSTIPITTFTTTTKGVVETGTLESVAVSFLTGVLTTTMATSVETVLYPTTINGTPQVATSFITDTREQTVVVTPQPTSTAANSSPATKFSFSMPITTTTVTASVGLTTHGSSASTLASGTGSVYNTTQPSTTASSLMPTTIMTMTTVAPPSSHPTANAPYVMPPMNMHTFWWIPLAVIFSVVAVLIGLWLWRRCARKSFDRAVHSVHEAFETIGGIIFGKRWAKWKAIRNANRRKKAEIKNRQSPLDEHHIRNVLLRRWNETVENHRRQGTMPEHSNPPSTASGETWRQLNRDTLLSNPQSEAMEMTNLAPRARPATNSDDMHTISSQGIFGNKEQGNSREVPSSLGFLSRTVSDKTNMGVPKTEVASPLPLLEEGRLKALAPWPEQWPEAPHPGVPWQPSDNDNKSLVSHNQWFEREVPPAQLRTQIQGDAERNSQTTPGENDIQSNAGFRGARSVWRTSNPQQPRKPVQTLPPTATTLVNPSTTIPSPNLPPDHPILSIPSPKPLPAEPTRSFNQASPNQDSRPSSRNGGLGSLLGRKKPISRRDISSPIPIPPHLQQQQPQHIKNPFLQPPSTPIPNSRPHLPTRQTSISEWTDATVPPTERPTSPPLLKAPRVPGWNTAAQSVTSAYSGYWEDEAGGKIKYGRDGKIRDVVFQGGGRVLLGSEAGGSRVGQVEREREGKDEGGSGGTGGGNWI